MKILLINPPDINEITTQVSKFITAKSSSQPPLGLAYIASVCIEGGFNDVKIIDCQAEDLSYDDLNKRVAEEKPDMVGMTSMTFTMVDVVFTANLVKKLFPNVKIVLGGPHVDIYPEETVKIPVIDFVITNEGEHPFLKLAKKIDSNKLEDLHEIENLVWLNDGNVITNIKTKNNNNYAEIPFPSRNLLPIQKYFSIATKNNPITTLVTAKGCPFRCVFCYTQKKVLYRETKDIVDEMETIQKMGIKEVFFVDDTFYVNPKFASSICDEIISRNLKIPWGARSRVNLISDQMLLKFKKAGCTRLHIGVESGNDKVLEALQKTINVKMVRKAFALCNKHNMDTMAYFIVGNPGETLKEAHDTINLAIEINPTFAQFSRMTPFPATKLYDMGIEKKIISHDYWKEFAEDPTKPVSPQFWTEHFTQDELTELADYATQKFYVRPGYIFRTFMKLRTIDDFLRKFKTGISLIYSRKTYNKFKLKMV